MCDGVERAGVEALGEGVVERPVRHAQKRRIVQFLCAVALEALI
jgi:hypothetical protein